MNIKLITLNVKRIMKKLPAFLMLALVLTSFLSCESNEPGKTEKTSIPVVARTILRTKSADAQQTLKNMGWYAPDYVVQTDEINFVYPKELASEDEKKQEKAYRGSWMQLSGYTEGTDLIQTIWGEHYLPSAAEASKVFNQWTSHFETTIQDYDLHVVMINKEGDYFVFEEGKLFDEYKDSRLKLYQEALAKRQITQQDYDEEYKRLSITKSDLKKYLSVLSLNEEYSHYDIYIEIANINNYNGIRTMSTFENYAVENSYGVSEQRMLEHRLEFTNVKDMIDDLLSACDDY